MTVTTFSMDVEEVLSAALAVVHECQQRLENKLLLLVANMADH